MQDFEYVVCTQCESTSGVFSLDKEYKVIYKTAERLTIFDNYGEKRDVPFDGGIWHFSPVYDKVGFIPVSGDQSLFNLVNAQDTHLYVVRNRGESGIYATTQTKMDKYPKLKDRVLAQRKVKEKDYIPVVGDTIQVEGEHEGSLIYEVVLIGDWTIVLKGIKGYFDNEFTVMGKGNGLLKKAKRV